MDFLATPDFWVAVSFILFFCLLAYFGLHKKLGAALDTRAEAIAKEIDQATTLRKEAESVLADYRKKQGNAAKEAQAIVDLATKEAKALAAETSRNMKEQFERRMKLAESKIARAEVDAVNDVRAAAAEAAVAAAQAVIAGKMTATTADTLIDQGIDALKSKLN